MEDAFMTPNELMNKICDEADKQSQFYKDISNVAETRDKLKYITMIIEHFNCEFDCARAVVDYIIDGTPLPSDLSPQEQAYNNAVAQDWSNKPKCPYSSQRHRTQDRKALRTKQRKVRWSKRKAE